MKTRNDQLISALARLHDEKIDKFEVIDGKLVLTISEFESEWNSNLKSAVIIFSGFNDINKDVEFYYLKRVTYPYYCGKHYQFKGLLKSQERWKFYIVTVYQGKNTVMITGAMYCKNGACRSFRMIIHAETVEYLSESW